MDIGENRWPSKVGLRLIECFAAPFPPGTMQHSKRRNSTSTKFHWGPPSSARQSHINPINLSKAYPSFLAFYKQWPWHAIMKISLWEAFKVEVLNSLYICKHETWSVRLIGQATSARHLRYLVAVCLGVQSRMASRSNLHAAWATRQGEPRLGAAALVFCATHPLYITVLYRSLQIFTVVLAVDVLVCFSILMYSHFRNAHRDYISCLHVFTNKVRARRIDRSISLSPWCFHFPLISRPSCRVTPP